LWASSGKGGDSGIAKVFAPLPSRGAMRLFVELAADR